MSTPSRAIEFKEERVELFPTHLFRRTYEGLEGFNRQLRESILDKERELVGKSMTRSNVGSWHSENDLLRWQRPEISVLLDLLRSTIMQYVGVELRQDPATFDLVMTMEAWANVSRSGNYSRPHVHPMSNFAMVYYVDAGDDTPEEPLSGSIEFLDPRNRITMLSTPGVSGRDSLNVRPRTSTMLMFPSWIYHYVHPYRGERPRISIATNVTVRELKKKEPASPASRPSAVIIED